MSLYSTLNLLHDKVRGEIINVAFDTQCFNSNSVIKRES